MFHVPPTGGEQIEGDEDMFATTVEQVPELRTAGLVEDDNLAIEHRCSSTKVAGYRQGKLLKRFERVPVARHQAANSVLYEGKRTEAIILQLKEPIWMSECFSAAAEKHWLELRGHCRNFIPPGAGNQTAGLEHLTFMAKQDPKRVNRNEKYEVEYIAKTRNVTEAQVKDASKKAGPMRKAIDKAPKAASKKK
jgi:hypothetical protein